MSDYTPPPELVEAPLRVLLRHDGYPEDHYPLAPQIDEDNRALTAAMLTAAVAFRSPTGDPELVPWEQVRELVDAADNAHRALDVVLSIPSESGGILGAQSVASHAQGVLRAALAPFTQEPPDANR